MNYLANFLTLAACLTLVLCQACSPATPLTSTKSEKALEEDFPSHLIEGVVVDEAVPDDLEVPEETEPEHVTEPEPNPEPAAGEKPAGPPDWKARYRELNAEYKAAFVPPQAGKQVKLALTTGQIHEGRLVSMDTQGVKLAVQAGEIEIQRKTLAMKIRIRLFAEDYAHEKALRVVKMEKRKYDLARQQEFEATLAEKAEAAAQAKRREAIKNRGKVVLPVNDPQDGSVPAVVAYIKRTTRDPESIKFLQWYKVIPKDGKYIVRCRYRADGGDLGELTLDKYFFLNASGRVYQSANFKGQ